MRLGASRLDAVGESATLAVQTRAAALRERGIDVIDLGVGEPDFATPSPIAQAVEAALRAGHTRYTPTIGIPALRQVIADRYRSRWSCGYTAANVAVTVGAKQALYNLFLSVLEPGDEVLVPTPCWVSFPAQLRLVGAQPILVPCPAEAGFVIDPDAIAAAITPKTRALILNSPCNPTGAVIPRDILARIVNLVRGRDIFVVFDETYEHFAYGGEGHVSAAIFQPQLGEQLVIVNSFSKTYAMTGLRLGFVIAAPEVIRGVASIQSHTTSNPTSIVQYGAIEALRSAETDIAAMIAEYRRRREFTLAELATVPGIELVPPSGAFYAFPSVECVLTKMGIRGSLELSRRLLEEAHVAVVPGVAFEAEGFIRISFAAAMDSLREGLDRLRRFVSAP